METVFSSSKNMKPYPHLAGCKDKKEGGSASNGEVEGEHLGWTGLG